MEAALPLACFLSMIRPPGIQFEDALLQIAPVDKVKCPFVKNNNDVGFYLYTRHNPTVPHELAIDDDERLFASSIDWHDTTVIYFHAFMEQPNDGSALAVRQAYMQRGDANVIMIDAQRLEAGPWYFTAAENTWYIGRFAGQFIDYLVSRGLDLSRTHLVGHSLGAQSAGVAGAGLKSGRVSRITALDPALPLFSKLPLEQRLDPSDAEFVDVIHTDAGIFGFDTPVGHVDFYPNGGISPQPGCELEVVTHQKLLLNKCDTTKRLGFYEFHLTPTRDIRENLWSTFEEQLWTLFKLIRSWFTDEENTREAALGSELKINNDSRKLNSNKDLYEPYDDLVQKNGTEISTIDKPEEESDIIKKGRKEKKHYLKVSKAVTDKSVDKTKATSDVAKGNEGNVDFSKRLNIEAPKNVNVKETREQDVDIKATNDEQISLWDLITNLDKAVSDELLNINEEAKHLFETKEGDTDVENDRQTHDLLPQESKSKKSHVVKRQKRFLPFLKKSETVENENFLFRMLEFLLKHRRTVVPVFTVMREINTLVKSANGELNHSTKERNNYIGAPPTLQPISYTLELSNENRAVAFVKKLLGLSTKGDKLVINNGK